MANWIIKHTRAIDGETGEPLTWNNANGFGIGEPSIFSDKEKSELRLPNILEPCEWVETSLQPEPLVKRKYVVTFSRKIYETVKIQVEATSVENAEELASFITDQELDAMNWTPESWNPEDMIDIDDVELVEEQTAKEAA